MPIPYFPHSGRRAHYWKLRVDGFRELQTRHGWGFRGAYAEKTIRGQRVMQTIVTKTDDYYVCCFKLKDDFWSAITADARRRDAEAKRKSLRVVTDGEAEEAEKQMATVRWPITPDLDPMQLDQASLTAIAKQARLCRDSIRAQIRTTYPSLTEADLDDLLV